LKEPLLAMWRERFEAIGAMTVAAAAEELRSKDPAYAGRDFRDVCRNIRQYLNDSRFATGSHGWQEVSICHHSISCHKDCFSATQVPTSDLSVQMRVALGNPRDPKVKFFRRTLPGAAVANSRAVDWSTSDVAGKKLVAAHGALDSRGATKGAGATSASLILPSSAVAWAPDLDTGVGGSAALPATARGKHPEIVVPSKRGHYEMVSGGGRSGGTDTATAASDGEGDMEARAARAMEEDDGMDAAEALICPWRGDVGFLYYAADSDEMVPMYSVRGLAIREERMHKHSAWFAAQRAALKDSAAMKREHEGWEEWERSHPHQRW